MNFAPDLATVTHGIQLAVAPVFCFLAGVVCFLFALVCFLTETLLATHMLNFAELPAP